MTAARIIEFSVSALVAFLILATVSFLTLRPALKEVRAEARAEWHAFLKAVEERNDVLGGLVEALRGYESGQGKLAANLLQARTVIMRATKPGTIMAAVNDMEGYLLQVRKLARPGRGLQSYPPFAHRWHEVQRSSERIMLSRRLYNKSARTYNQLLAAFPQNLLALVFGFVPLDEYPAVRTIANR